MEPARSGAPDPEVLKAIRRDWDSRAREDARHYINWPDIPNEEGAFFESGRQDYQRFVAPFLKRMNFDSRGKTALEIGCGIGRIARWMAQDFEQYIGVDVSPEMVRKAAAYALPHATFQTVSGAELGDIAAGSVDFVFSLGVFQHVPDGNVVVSYFTEIARVLRPGGIFRVQVKGLWAWRLGSLALEAGLSNKIKVGTIPAPFLRVRHLDTWQGTSISSRRAVRECRRRGLSVEEIEGKGTVLMWIGGRRN